MGVLTPLAQATAFVKLLVSDAHAVGGRWSFFFPYKLCEKNPRDEHLTGDGYICHKQDGGRGNKRALCFSPRHPNKDAISTLDKKGSASQ